MRATTLVSVTDLPDSDLRKLFDPNQDLAVYSHIAIADLPDGGVKDELTLYVNDPTEAKIYIVVGTGSIQDWAAYYSAPNIRDMSQKGIAKMGGREYALHHGLVNYSAERTLAVGNKLSESVATALFPKVAQMAKRYRS